MPQSPDATRSASTHRGRLQQFDCSITRAEHDNFNEPSLPHGAHNLLHRRTSDHFPGVEETYGVAYVCQFRQNVAGDEDCLAHIGQIAQQLCI